MEDRVHFRMSTLERRAILVVSRFADFFVF